MRVEQRLEAWFLLDGNRPQGISCRFKRTPRQGHLVRSVPQKAEDVQIRG
jgi:hypothetical protein